VLWAVALGAEVTVISRSDKKKKDALEMGAHHFIATDKEDWHKAHEFGKF
jgi:D-arabinose 1-dehydrogenase-like Zn-dependent alcohol dehydrogenase